MAVRTRRFLVSPRVLATRETALRLMARHGLAGWKFAFNNNVRRAGVCCIPRSGGPGRIELSVHFIERNPDSEVLDVILHEIAHALAGPGQGHNHVWKAKCVEIGARPERCYQESVDMPKGRWRCICPVCGHESHRHRRPKVLTGWSCMVCKKARGLLIWSRRD